MWSCEELEYYLIYVPKHQRGRAQVECKHGSVKSADPFMIVAPLGLAHFATTQSCLEECVDEMKIKM